MIREDGSFVGIGEDVRKPGVEMLKWNENAIRVGNMFNQNKERHSTWRKAECGREKALLGAEVTEHLIPTKFSSDIRRTRYRSREGGSLNQNPVCSWYSIPVVSTSGELQGVIKLKTTHGIEEMSVE